MRGTKILGYRFFGGALSLYSVLFKSTLSNLSNAKMSASLTFSSILPDSLVCLKKEREIDQLSKLGTLNLLATHIQKQRNWVSVRCEHHTKHSGYSKL